LKQILSRTMAVLIALTMCLGAFAVLPYSASSETAVQENIADPDAMDIGPSIRAQTFTADDVLVGADLKGISMGESTLADSYEVNDTNWYYTWGYGASSWMLFTKRAEGNYSEVWVANDLSFPAGDLRNDQRINITNEMCEYMVEQFDETIYPIETEYFSDAPPLNGTNNEMFNIFNDPADFYNTTDDGKVMIMVFNIADENFDNSSYPNYIAGFYTSSASYYYDRNIIHIDCWDWVNRTGEHSDRPFLYESTVAHEYQHLLHDYVDPEEVTWINEGCSMYSEALCGYGYSYDHMADFFDMPYNSLTDWGDLGDINILGDYGAVLMFMIYMNDHFGGSSMISAIMQNPLHGEESITDSLNSLGYNRWNFESVFKYWRLANLIWDDDVGGGLYTYTSIDKAELGHAPLIINGAWPIDFGQGWRIGGLGSYGTDYLYFYDPGYLDLSMSEFSFDGDDVDYYNAWHYVDGDWWSGQGDEVDRMLTLDVDLTTPAEGGEYLHWLNMSTWWDIEDEWDFGFVQVSTDGGETWTSLNDTGEWFTEDHDPDAMPSIVENLPGLTSWPGDYELHNLSFDLSAYDGQEIMVGFRYMTDWGTTEDGWYIDGVCVDGAEIDLMDLTPVYNEVDFLLTIYVPGNGERLPMVMDIPVDCDDETATKLLGSLWDTGGFYVLVSTVGGTADYMMFGGERNMSFGPV